MLEELDQLKEAAERTRTLERGEVREREGARSMIAVCEGWKGGGRREEDGV